MRTTLYAPVACEFDDSAYEVYSFTDDFPFPLVEGMYVEIGGEFDEIRVGMVIYDLSQKSLRVWLERFDCKSDAVWDAIVSGFEELGWTRLSKNS